MGTSRGQQQGQGSQGSPKIGGRKRVSGSSFTRLSTHSPVPASTHLPPISVIGCRYAGIGYFGDVVASNVDLGIASANSCGGSFIVHASTAHVTPNIATEATILIMSVHTKLDDLLTNPMTFRADLFVLTECHRQQCDVRTVTAMQQTIGDIRGTLSPPILRTYSSPRIVDCDNGSAIECMWFTTAEPSTYAFEVSEIERRHQVLIQS
eukprot:GFYU01044182.1.p1 GENE.GFYU01044182.1~~GFYU01044182.1.p1  ORF type:complete len:208 (+),score=25.33 GFYU01044182.1:2-625(+)